MAETGCTPPRFLRANDLPELKVIVLHCPICGIFVAASPIPKIITMAAEIHSCYEWPESP